MSEVVFWTKVTGPKAENESNKFDTAVFYDAKEANMIVDPWLCPT